MKKIMILGASILQLPAIRKAKEMGLDIIAVDMDPLAIGFNVQGIKKEVISTIDTSAILEAARRNHIDGIMTLATDMPMQSVAVVSRELGLVGIDERTALKATNKAYMRDALKEMAVPIPLYYYVSEEKEFIEAVKKIRKLGCQCIVKPADNSGSRGVNLVEENSDLTEIYKYAKKYSRGGNVIVEEFMEGPEVSVETLAIDGVVHVIQITDKITTGAPYFVEMGHSQPSQLSEEDINKIKEVTVMANNAIGIKNGPSHTEIKVTKDGPKIIEIGARLGGDCITSHLVPLSTGVDMVECCIKIALGESPDLTQKFEKGSAISYLNTSEGIIKKITGIENAKKITGVIQVSIVHDVGERLGKIKSSNDRACFIIAQGNNANDAIKNAKKGLNLINMVI